MRLVQIDLSRSTPPNEHPDILDKEYYLLKMQSDAHIDGFFIQGGRAHRYRRNGGTELQIHVGSHMFHFNPPGYNHSRIIEMWHVIDEPAGPIGFISMDQIEEVEQIIRQDRRERRTGRSTRRRNARTNGPSDGQSSAVDLLG